MNTVDLIAFVVSSGILDEYQLKDECLGNLISAVSASPKDWHDFSDISVSRQLVPASQIERIFRSRLRQIPDEAQFTSAVEKIGVRQLRIATQQLVDYCVDHPNANITGVTFNCPEHSYQVFCGLVDRDIDAVCVIVGKSIPSYAMRR